MSRAADAPDRKMMAIAHHFMRPIARLLIRSSITYKDFADLCKAVFVEVACEDYGLQGRPANTARVAIITGLSRKDVKKMRDRLRDGVTAEATQVGHASRVLARWHQEAEFVDSNGKPRELPLEGANPSFALLLKRFGGDMPPGALFRELKHVGAIEETADGKVRLLKRSYMPAQLDPANLERSGEVLHDMAETIQHNLFRDEHVPSRFEGRASNPRIDAGAVPAFRALVEEHGEAFLYALDDWLSEHEVPAEQAGPKTIRVGVGVYQFEQTPGRRAKS